jgi:hypothetical protein
MPPGKCSFIKIRQYEVKANIAKLCRNLV